MPEPPRNAASTSKPRLLDLFCGAGGAALGYQRAGFYVVGVDHKPQPRYVGDAFVLGDVFEYLDYTGGYPNFDAIHAAPLWYGWTALAQDRHKSDSEHADQIAPTLEWLTATGLPFTLEVGTRSPQESVTICGVSLGLRVTRHMRFATNWPLLVPPCSHKHGGAADGLYVPFRGSYHKDGPGRRNVPHTRKAWREAAGLAWMTSAEADLASPPAYTELIGRALMAHLQREQCAA